MLHRILLLMAIVLLPYGKAIAQGVVPDPYTVQCSTSLRDPSPGYPGEERIASFNNLTQPPGKPDAYIGQRVVLTGRVFDAGCIPLKGAKVQIWQANPQGDMVYPATGAFSNPYPLFAGSGEAYTDNLGQYTFITLVPGSRKDLPPVIHFRVTHPKTAALFTRMYFSGDMRNEKDNVYKRSNDDRRKRMTGEVQPMNGQDFNRGLNVTYDITVEGRDPFRSY